MKSIKRYWNNELFRGSFILLILFNASNAINFLFQFLMARMLSPASFGVLSFLSNLLFLFGIPALAIQTTISKATTELMIKKKEEEIKGLFESISKRVFLTSLIFVFFYLGLSFLIKDFVKIPYSILAFFSLMIPISLFVPVVVGVLQGTKKFELVGLINVFLFGMKFFFGIVLVLIGWEIWGAIAGIIVGTYLALPVGFFLLKGIKKEKKKTELNLVEKFPEIFGLLIITLVYSLDVLVAKFIFSPETAGNYSKISLLGKIVLFAGMSVSNVMFPISSEKKIIGGESKNIFRKAFLLNTVIIALGIGFLYFFGGFIIGLVFGKEYLFLNSITLRVICAFGVIALAVLFVLYDISINRFKKINSWMLFILIVAEIIILSFSKELDSFVNRFFYLSIVLFIISSFNFIKWKRSA